MKSSWKFFDLIDFEELLQRKKKVNYGLEVRESLSSQSFSSETDKRRAGLKLWFSYAKNDLKPITAQKIRFSFGLITCVLCILGFLLGFILVHSLVEQVTIEGQGINIWKFLSYTLGLQVVFILAGLFAWLVWNRSRVPLGLFGDLLTKLAQKLAGCDGEKVMNQLSLAGRSYRIVISLRVFRMTQLSAAFFNAGLLLGLLACLFFLEIGFFWSTTLESISKPQLLNLTNFISIPWAWFYSEGVPTEEALELTQLQIGRLNAAGKPSFWYPFLFCSIGVWGILPRIGLWLAAIIFESRTLGKLSFIERRHRELWRSIHVVEVGEITEQPADQVVLIINGGLEVDVDKIKPFLLQKLRVSPIGKFEVGVLDGNEKGQAIEVIKRSKKGVVILVESWNLSPKGIKKLHRSIREVAPSSPLNFVVVAQDKDSSLISPSDTDFTEWKDLLVTIEDPEAEVTPYTPMLHV